MPCIIPTDILSKISTGVSPLLGWGWTVCLAHAKVLAGLVVAQSYLIGPVY